MATSQLRTFGCEMPIRANFGDFLGILIPKIVKLLFSLSEVRTSQVDTRFEILRVKIDSAVSSVALFKY